jgi:4-hydroxy-tetrahydrodipicolinate synthase
MKELKGIMPPMITAFADDESFDEAGTRSHVSWLIENGVHGLIPCGSTGEFISMDEAERKKVIETVIDETAGRVLVYAGTADYSTRKTIAMSRFAEKAGADGVMVINPYYLQPPIPQVLDHFRAIRDAISIPLMLYNNPHVCGYELSAEHIRTLIDEGTIQSVKVAAGPAQQVHELRYMCGDKGAIFYGADLEAPEGLLAGAVGWVTSAINAVPRVCRELYDAAATGDVEKTFGVWNRLMPLIWFTYNRGVHWLQVVKTAVALRGRPGGPPRKPMTPLEGAKREELRKILDGMGVL